MSELEERGDNPLIRECNEFQKDVMKFQRGTSTVGEEESARLTKLRIEALVRKVATMVGVTRTTTAEEEENKMDPSPPSNPAYGGSRVPLSSNRYRPYSGPVPLPLVGPSGGCRRPSWLTAAGIGGGSSLSEEWETVAENLYTNSKGINRQIHQLLQQLAKMPDLMYNEHSNTYLGISGSNLIDSLGEMCKSQPVGQKG
jgi:hypothetical protein